MWLLPILFAKSAAAVPAFPLTVTPFISQVAKGLPPALSQACCRQALSFSLTPYIDV
jgi:hypothetical protein